ncbi:maleylacetate reductase [Verminephrobacter aporrectodeae]|uniref:Maleylacetate reductase n=1 Tax=Verminephrobacter aporrectodeae subsp. tuberculatae TaxID=1110392 RepID=A0ABT3KTB8_9BURK|nr:maleylacetate reductase [Verminephrobacter aporrectodeae]MCW5222540.1 maleylacetate reductase [Verminephrobacter aporrectodeae subsp. tuberculatae]MCW5257250.1 maleylacetate reductase [Verminephrobacter aporrectodeae subsp. tuberculatae]MCW5288005.1 maleylacetate reductase [Verminephrobacter aporrectodeae subsp. tuberculatae]MCW5321567.1 maleylacetate reductase [Verminephrobacter aporrectodeae subsp. tuberculatae]MCW8163478.1 maleylacetate reductase [Verminephrobacter aporrectodeae subsp. t
MDFFCQSLPGRVRFANGCIAQTGNELQELGIAQALVLCTPRQRTAALALIDRLGPRAAGLFDQAAMHVPVDGVARARELVVQTAADGVLAYGGGSTVGLAKAIALETGLPIVAVPTTYAGSEMTPIYGLTEGGLKRTGRDPRVLPRSVLYDPTLTLELPLALSISSGLNAIAHAAEGLYARDGNPVLGLMAEEGIRALAQGLAGLLADARELRARADCLYGAWLCGSVLGQAGMALHHKLCHVLGGAFHLPHAQTHAVMLAHTLAYNAPAAPQAMARIARALDCRDGPRGVQELALRLGAPMALRDIGMDATGLDRALELALQNPYWNPRPLERDALRGLLRRAWSGDPVAA